jgi:hypothetical protein
MGPVNQIRSTYITACVTNADHHEREGYTASLQEGNHENHFVSAQETAIDIDSHEPVLTGSIMTDVNGERSLSESRTLDTLLGLATATSPTSDHYSEDAVDTLDNGEDEPDHSHEPVISYNLRGKPALMSAWEDPHMYFTGTFPTLFPTGIGGHLDQREVLVSLEAYAQWAMNHHSRR